MHRQFSKEDIQHSAQASHQCRPPGHSCRQHGCPGGSRPRQEEVTLEPLALDAHLPWGVSLGLASPLTFLKGPDSHLSQKAGSLGHAPSPGKPGVPLPGEKGAFRYFPIPVSCVQSILALKTFIIRGRLYSPGLGFFWAILGQGPG